ncbi:Cytochrome c, class I [Sphingobium indicum BiD32]|uniref:Cytochrome c, class I n=1 Tax=Sphingobium indicum BiD32 TaxID=1301087 RepID=N1MIF1_9SPHN|nr:c-type cytochrome [Sphingobium indicum]CCW17010.1 Cytochrome c, class I [Sphingobium indicum BiD32]
MKAPVIFAACAGVAVLVFAARPAVVDAQGASSELVTQCASCHALTKPANPTVDHLWTRKGPDLWYAGDKFNRDWLASWLQNPTTIRPGGVFWFKHAKAGEPRDTIDAAAVEKHPKVDAATAGRLADALLQLKSGLAPDGVYKPEAANMTMGKLAFSKLRGCVACHQDARGQGGLSGPELYDAGQRLRPDYVIAYTKNPQQFDPHIWMPTATLSEPDLQRLTGYITSLGKENK